MMSARFLTIFLMLALAAPSFGASSEFVFRPGGPPVASSKWGKRVIPLALSNSLRSATALTDRGADAEAAVRAAADTWTKASGIEFQLYWTDADTVSSVQRGDGLNLVTIAPTSENLLMFSSDSDNPARARIFTGRRGLIAEADIVLNPYQQFSTDGSFGTYDFQSVVTHELGHLLGLKHSVISGATMSERVAKNGAFGLDAFGPRTLSSDDLVALRGLYALASDSCCGTVSGRVPELVGRKALIWLEEKGTGRVMSVKNVDDYGAFRFEGLQAGDYLLRIDSAADVVLSRPGVRFAEAMVSVSASETVEAAPVAEASRRRFAVPFIGFNDQFAPSTPVVFASSIPQRMLLGATGAFSDGLKFKSTSPFITVLGVQVFGGRNLTGATVFAIDFLVDPKTPAGEYTLVASDGTGAEAFLVGALKIGNSSDSASRR